MTLNISPKKKLLLFICWFALFFFIAVVFNAIIMMMFGTSTTTSILATIFQDLFVMIAPVAVTLLMVERSPIEYVWLNKSPKPSLIILIFLIVVAQIPAINAMMKLNSLIPLPTWMAENEEVTKKAIDMMFGDYSAIYFIIGIVVVGVLAAFSEEFLFRGFLTRVMSTRFSAHTTIWVIAAIFSFVHFQFAGFVPRMFLGAMFGYLALWSGSLWTAIIAHFANNTLALCAMFLTEKHGYTELNDLGAGVSAIDVTAIVVSVISFVTLTCLYRRVALRSNQGGEDASANG